MPASIVDARPDDFETVLKVRTCEMNPHFVSLTLQCALHVLHASKSSLMLRVSIIYLQQEEH